MDDEKNHEELKSISYSTLSENEIAELKQFEQRLNSDRNKEMYVLAFEKNN